MARKLARVPAGGFAFWPAGLLARRALDLPTGASTSHLGCWHAGGPARQYGWRADWLTSRASGLLARQAAGRL